MPVPPWMSVLEERTALLEIAYAQITFLGVIFIMKRHLKGRQSDRV